jgi:1,4-alpha-glucan branching enzyme
MTQLIIHFPAIELSHPLMNYCRLESRCEHSGTLAPEGADDYGLVFKFNRSPSHFSFTISDQEQGYTSPDYFYQRNLGQEVWCRLQSPDLYSVRPFSSNGHVNEVYEAINHLIPNAHYLPNTDVSSPGKTYSMLGATPLLDGRILFGIFHPKAARIYLAGEFNDWQSPGHPQPDPDQFISMVLYRGYHDHPNIWLALITPPVADREWEYTFYIQEGVIPTQTGQSERFVPDPLTRAYGRDVTSSNSRVIYPSKYAWHDQNWKTPPIHDLIVYEASIYGMTQGTPGIDPEQYGTFDGMISLIKQGYLNHLGVNALALMPTSEAPSRQGAHTLGYDPCGFSSIERDFGHPDDLRRLVDTAHSSGLAVIADLVFNHTSNSFNPLWGLIDDGTEGGLYFSGSTPWGNRVATEREEIQNYLIDVGKLLLKEYHFDGFRFDATNSAWMDHGFLQRFAAEIRDMDFKPDCILIAENLPNESDLNFEGYNGFIQWCDPFHDKIKALLREGVYQDWVTNDPTHLGDVFYFSKSFYASHTNNALNYCESHDENSVPFEVSTTGGELIYDEVKSRKARLGLFATAVALGQPMLYMGQEFGTDRPRNLVLFDWPDNPKQNTFYAWTRRLLSLRKRYPGLRIHGYNPAEDGKFQWILGPWMDSSHGADKTVIGWRTSTESNGASDEFAILLNFGNEPIMVDLELGRTGRWVKLADIDTVNDLPPYGSNSPFDPSTLASNDGRFGGFTIPENSGFIFKWNGEEV